MGARRRAVDTAVRLGRMLKEARIRRELTQGELARACALSQPFVSHLERGLGATTSLETWSIVGRAVGLDMAAFFEAASGASLPIDYQHLKRQQLVISVARDGRWQTLPEAPIEFDRLRSRSIDVLLFRSARARLRRWRFGTGSTISAKRSEAWTLRSPLSSDTSRWRGT